MKKVHRARFALLRQVAVLLTVVLVASTPLLSQQPPGGGSPPWQNPSAADLRPLPTIAEKVEGATKLEGFLDLYLHEDSGQLWLELGAFGEQMIHQVSLSAGVGSNDIGLDRGQLGGTHLVSFERIGRKVLLVEHNTGYRAESENPDEVRAVEEAFARSVLWGFKAIAAEGDRVLVNATPFLLADGHGVARSLERTSQGSYRVDQGRSAVYAPRTKSFPLNTEMESILTLVGQPKGDWIRSVTPTAEAVTVRQRHSFIALPEPGYEPRPFDPRSGLIGRPFFDYGTPISQPLQRSYSIRHRLEKVDPSAAESEAKEPIVYYLDPGTPEPIRSALLDGARWWNQAFEAAGYRDAYRVEMMPPGGDALDVRYNVIQWVHRSTRGWSYGSSVVDPRTGEILKGHVTLGSLRVRQDFLIAAALLAPYGDDGSVPEDMQELALARLRQLSAHEVGHTLGFTHNFAASVNSRASVMDYPHPLVELDRDGNVSVANAYDVGIGEWDKRTVIFGYQDFPDGTDEAAALEEILAENRRLGLHFIADADSRPLGGAHPLGHLWDNGADASAELDRLLSVRQVALERFGERNVALGRPLWHLEDAIVPLFLLHRYQIEGAAKLVAGVDYTYAVRGDGQAAQRVVDAEQQRAALHSLTSALHADVLTTPESVLDSLSPPPFGARRGRENFPSRTAPTFDPVAAAEVAAQLVVDVLLRPERADRLVQQSARDVEQLSLDEVLEELVDTTWRSDAPSGLTGEVKRAIDAVTLAGLGRLAHANEASLQVRGHALLALEDLRAWLEAQDPSGPTRAHHRAALLEIERLLDKDAERATPSPQRAPDGPPIGGGDLSHLSCDAPPGFELRGLTP